MHVQKFDMWQLMTNLWAKFWFAAEAILPSRPRIFFPHNWNPSGSDKWSWNPSRSDRSSEGHVLNSVESQRNGCLSSIIYSNSASLVAFQRCLSCLGQALQNQRFGNQWIWVLDPLILGHRLLHHQVHSLLQLLFHRHRLFNHQVQSLVQSFVD